MYLQMKKISIILFVLINTCFFSQTAPQLINYQGIARNASGVAVVGSVGLMFQLRAGSAAGAITYSETLSTTTNSFGIFNVQIGSGDPTNFALINWGATTYFLEVLLDPSGGNSYLPVGSQQLVSVPYALYAKSAGNSANYSPGTNITFSGPVTSPTISSNPSLSLAGNQLSISGSGSPVTLPTSSLTASPNVSVTSTGINSFNINIPNYVAGNNVTIVPPSSGNNYTINATGSASTATGPFSLTVNSPHTYTTSVNTATINIVAPNLSVTGGGGVVTNNVLPNYAISIPTIVVTPTPGGLSFTQNASTSTVAIAAGGPWTTTGGTHHLITGVNNVGIGTTNSTAKLTVTTSIANDAILAQSQSANGILAMSASSGTTDAGVYGTNTGAGYGVRGETISTNTNVAGVYGASTGNANGVFGKTSSAIAGVAGVKGVHSSGGAGVYGENLSGTGSVNAHGVKGLTGNPGAQAAGVSGVNISIGAGVFGENNGATTFGSAHGVAGKTNGTAVNAYGVMGDNIGGGSGVYGRTTSGAINAAGVMGENFGTGAALKATLPTATVSGGMNVAVLLENGHIKATSTQSAASNFSVSFSQSGTHTIIPNANNNDVRGIVTYTTNQTGPLASVGTYVNINTTFSKTYSIPPVVVITSMNASMQGWDLYLHQVNNTFFVVRAINNTGGSTTPPGNITFSYIVIE